MADLRRVVFAVLPGTAWLLAGCATSGAPEVPSVTAPPPPPAAVAADGPPAPAWWTRPGDSVLADWVEAAARSNLTARAAAARLRAAAHQVAEMRYARWPSLQPRGGVRAEQDSERTGRFNEDRANGSTTTWDAGVDAAWELDVWGRSASALEAARQDEAAGRASLADLRHRLRLEAGRAYLRLREAEARAELSRRAVSNQTAVLRLAEVRRDAGRGTDLDVLRARALVATSAADEPLWQESARREAVLLAVLAGRTPDTLTAASLPPAAPPAWPPPQPPADPGAVLSRRPDLEAAAAAVRAALARARVSRLEGVPRLSLQGAVGVEAEEAGDLAASDALAWNTGLRLRWAGLDTLRLRARAAAAGEQAEVALAEYEQRVLEALREVENAHARHRRAAARLARLEEALAASDAARALVRVRYRDGLTDFLPVLDAEREHLRLEDSLATARAELAHAALDFFAAFPGEADR
jgi:multidrug efflux system outer membrane protein